MFPASSVCRPEVFNGQRYLLKSVHYAALNRADLFTLPCPPEVYFSGTTPHCSVLTLTQDLIQIDFNKC